jgi:hypothetical protein
LEVREVDHVPDLWHEVELELGCRRQRVEDQHQIEAVLEV